MVTKLLRLAVRVLDDTADWLNMLADVLDPEYLDRIS